MPPKCYYCYMSERKEKTLSELEEELRIVKDREKQIQNMGLSKETTLLVLAELYETKAKIAKQMHDKVDKLLK